MKLDSFNCNLLNITNSTYGEYTEKLNILNHKGFNEFIEQLENISINRNLSGMACYKDLASIAMFLTSFDEIRFDDNLGTSMYLVDFTKIMNKFNPNMTDQEFKKWIYNGMICGVASMIDEDIRYGVINDTFLCNLRDFLCSIVIFDFQHNK